MSAEHGTRKPRAVCPRPAAEKRDPSTRSRSRGKVLAAMSSIDRRCTDAITADLPCSRRPGKLYSVTERPLPYRKVATTRAGTSVPKPSATAGGRHRGRRARCFRLGVTRNVRPSMLKSLSWSIRDRLRATNRTWLGCPYQLRTVAVDRPRSAAHRCERERRGDVRVLTGRAHHGEVRAWSAW